MWLCILAALRFITSAELFQECYESSSTPRRFRKGKTLRTL
jgi:hypothetical protein